MKLADFDYIYPEELVAQRPPASRDASRMMVIDPRSKTSRHSSIIALPKCLNRGDLLVINDTKVFPARLIGKKESGGEIEILLLEEIDHKANIWKAVATRMKKLKGGAKIGFGCGLAGEIIDKDGCGVTIKLSSGSFVGLRPPQDDTCSCDNIRALVGQIGLPPLPPYIKRERSSDYTDEDRERYQTIYAKQTGSAAAPTAGFHLTENILKECSDKGVEIVPITLHIGLDTFLPVRSKEIEDHKMHGENFSISSGSMAAITMAKNEGRRVVAVGTTTVRALESFFRLQTSDIGPKTQDAGHRTVGARDTRYEIQNTDLFIYPGYKFKIVDAILTNFHQPKSTLIMMISAFAGREFILQMYAEAIKERYRLFSYGDCMLII